MGKWTQEPWKVVPGWRKHDFGICGDYHRNENGGQSCVHIIDVLGNETSGKIPSENAHRAVACVNAMQGISAPAKLVAAFDAMLSALRYSHAIVKNISLGGKEHHNGAADDAVVLIERAIDQALAAKPTEGGTQ